MESTTVSSRVCTACKLEKPLTAFYKHPVGPYGRACKCIPCAKAVNVAGYRKNRQARLEKMRAWKRAWSRKQGRSERFTLPPEFAELDVGVGWKSQSKEYARILKRRYYDEPKYKVANVLNATRRRTSRVRWADEAKIAEIYSEARRQTEATGVKHVVDHIIPIKHPLVCGLHVETNLRVITQYENGRKKNKFEVV
jgi:hypothetical protein